MRLAVRSTAKFILVRIMSGLTQVERLSHAHEIAQKSRRGVGLGANGAQGAGNELDRLFDLGLNGLRRRKLRRLNDHAQEFLNVAVALPESVCDLGHKSGRGIVADEPADEFGGDESGSRGVAGEEIDDFKSVLHSPAGRYSGSENKLLSRIMHAGIKNEIRLPSGPADGPTGEAACDLHHIFLRVASIHAQCMKLHKLAGVVFVDALPGRGLDVKAKAI